MLTFIFFVFCFFLNDSSQAAAISAHGTLGLQHIWLHDFPTVERHPFHYSSTQIPLQLGLMIQPSDKLTLHLTHDVTFREFPDTSLAFGENQRCNTGNYQTTPFLQSVCQFYDASGFGRGFSPLVTYETEIGLFLAGRRLQHWGLGIWQNSALMPFGGKQDRVDGVGYIIDFAPFQVGTFFDINRYSSVSFSPLEQTFSIQILKQQETGEIKNFLNTTVGFVYSRFMSFYNKTRTNTFDLTGEMSVQNSWIGFEGIWIGGVTESEEYLPFGGLQNFHRKTINSWGSMIDSEFLISSENNDVNHTRQMRKHQPTLEWLTAHSLQINAGVASGQTTQFQDTSELMDFNGETDEESQVKVDKIEGFLFHPNIRPSLLMHNLESEFFASQLSHYNLNFPVGLSQRYLTNAMFLKGSYTFMSPKFGAITPSLIWSSLWKQPLLKDINPYERGIDDTARLPKNLGFEVDVTYSYRRSDFLLFTFQGGVWKPGQAWGKFLELNTAEVENAEKRLRPHDGLVYGLKMAAQLDF
jgi:hypothetical protein